VNGSSSNLKYHVMIMFNIFAKILPKFLPFNRATSNFNMKTRYQTPLIPKRYYAGEECYIYHNLTFDARVLQCL
jgi:hypothetical protein